MLMLVVSSLILLSFFHTPLIHPGLFLLLLHLALSLVVCSSVLYSNFCMLDSTFLSSLFPLQTVFGIFEIFLLVLMSLKHFISLRREHFLLDTA